MTPVDIPTSRGIIDTRISLQAGELVIKTSLLNQALCLFGYCRTLSVSKLKRQVEVRERRWWREHLVAKVPFGNIDHIDMTHPRAPEYESDEVDPTHFLFLITRKPSRRVDLFALRCPEFSGGSNRAVRCTAAIARIAGKRVGVHDPDDFPANDFKDTYRCIECGQRLSPLTDKLRCPYCGGSEIRIE